jgi:sterol 14-demethylase
MLPAVDFPGSWLPYAVAIAVCGLLVALMTPRGKNLPPFVVARIPIIGHFIAFTKPIDMIRDNYLRYGPVFSMNMMGQCLTFLVGPAAQAPFFKGKDDQLSQAAVYGFMTPVFGKGVVYDTTKSRRTQQMKLLANSLGTANMRTYVPLIVAEAEAFFAKWGESGTIDLKIALPELIILTASRCLMGDEVRKTLFQQVADLYHDLDKGIKPISFFFPNLPIPDHWSRDRARVEMVKLFGPIIRKRRAVFEAAASDPTEMERLAGEDVLAALIAFQYKDEGANSPRRPLTDDEITGLLIALLFAGQHTSSLTSAWAVMLLVSHPPVLAKMLAEQEAVLGGSSGTAAEPAGSLTLRT